MSTHRQHSIRRILLALAVATALPMTNAASIPTASATPPAGSGTTFNAAAALVVAPGRLASLRMGTATSTAKRLGWIARNDVCPGWTAGPRSIKVNKGGSEFFKAFPEKVKRGKVLSMWAAGEVFTTQGIRTDGLRRDARRGSSLQAIRSVYPNLRERGPWRLSSSGLQTHVYSVGSARRGWLDFFVADRTSRLSFVVVRTNDVNWQFKGADGC